jgi:hypothetical protein
MASTKNKKNTPQLTRRAALTTPPGVFFEMKRVPSWISAQRAIS